MKSAVKSGQVSVWYTSYLEWGQGAKKLMACVDKVNFLWKHKYYDDKWRSVTSKEAGIKKMKKELHMSRFILQSANFTRQAVLIVLEIFTKLSCVHLDRIRI